MALAQLILVMFQFFKKNYLLNIKTAVHVNGYVQILGKIIEYLPFRSIKLKKYLETLYQTRVSLEMVNTHLQTFIERNSLWLRKVPFSRF